MSTSAYVAFYGPHPAILIVLMSLYFQPMPLLKRAAPFDDPNRIFELKLDGFRALAVIEDGPRSTDLSQRASVRLMFGRLSGRA
jgi:hypothetical protein